MAGRESRRQRERQRALALLASCPDGCPEALLVAHGFSIELMVDLVGEGLASTTEEHLRAGKQTLEVTRVRITDAGRRALAA
jgi:hypothetical protein